MPRTAVPEAAIDEHRQLFAAKNEVGLYGKWLKTGAVNPRGRRDRRGGDHGGHGAHGVRPLLVRFLPRCSLWFKYGRRSGLSDPKPGTRNCSRTPLRHPRMPAARINPASRSSVDSLPADRIRAITAERLALVKTSGMGKEDRSYAADANPGRLPASRKGAHGIAYNAARKLCTILLSAEGYRLAGRLAVDRTATTCHRGGRLQDRNLSRPGA